MAIAPGAGGLGTGLLRKESSGSSVFGDGQAG